jgi:Na+/H+-dicarboxylate symporter
MTRSNRPGWLLDRPHLLCAHPGRRLGHFLPAEKYPAPTRLSLHVEGVHQPDQDAHRPLILSTIVVGIGKTGDIKAVGRMGAKAIIYFEIATTLALAIGLAIAHIVKPGEG